MNVVYVDFATKSLPVIEVDDTTATWDDYEASHQALLDEENKPHLYVV